MAGEIRGGNPINKPPVKKARKMWSLQDRSVVSVHLLKANLAEDGCEEAQLDVGKRLLADSKAECVDAAGQRENARLAVYWFIKASEQGNDEATSLLQECYDSGHGITCQNILDVKACLTTTRNEKLTFKAARLLYAKLCNGEDFITTIQLQARLDSKSYKSKVTFETVATQATNFGTNEHEQLNNHASTSAEDNDNDTSSYIRSCESEHLADSLKKNKYAAQSGVKLTLDDLTHIASKFNEGELPDVSIHSNSESKYLYDWNFFTPWTAFVLQLILFSHLLCFISYHSAVHVLCAYFSAWVSYNFVLFKSRMQTFQDWSELFRSALKEDVPWTDQKALDRFSDQYFAPYVTFSLLFLFLPGLIDSHFFLKCFIASALFLGLHLGGIRHFQKSISPGLYWWHAGAVILRIPLKTDWSEEYLNMNRSYRLPDFVGLLVMFPIVLVGYAIVVRFKKHTSPIHNKPHKTQLPGIFNLFMYALFTWLGTIITDCIWNMTEIEILGIAVLVFLVLGVYKLLTPSFRIKRLWCHTAMIFLVWLVLVGTFGTNSNPSTNQNLGSKSNNQSQLPSLSWIEYERNCHRPAWKIRSIAETEIYCTANYLNRTVDWTGKLSYVKLKDVQDSEFSKFPKNVQNLTNLQFEVLMSVGDQEELLSGYLQAGNGVQWNWFDLLPSMFSKQSETLAFAPVLFFVSTENLDKTGQLEATQLILSYRSGDILEFGGKLTKNAGGFKPEVGVVESLQCLSCAADGYRNNGKKIVFTEDPTLSSSILDQIKETMVFPNASDILTRLNISDYLGW